MTRDEQLLLDGLDGRADAELLGDRACPSDSFAAFYRRHAPALLRFVAGRGVDPDTAADVVADTFLAALRGRYDYRPEYDTARLWLLGIASRRIVDLHRRTALDRRRQRRLESEVSTLSQADRDSFDRLVTTTAGRSIDALADLTPDQAAAIRARVLEDRDYADVAEQLGLSQPAVRKHVSRGLLALRRTLGRAHE